MNLIKPIDKPSIAGNNAILNFPKESSMIECVAAADSYLNSIDAEVVDLSISILATYIHCGIRFQYLTDDEKAQKKSQSESIPLDSKGNGVSGLEEEIQKLLQEGNTLREALKERREENEHLKEGLRKRTSETIQQRNEISGLKVDLHTLSDELKKK